MSQSMGLKILVLVNKVQDCPIKALITSSLKVKSKAKSVYATIKLQNLNTTLCFIRLSLNAVPTQLI